MNKLLYILWIFLAFIIKAKTVQSQDLRATLSKSQVGVGETFRITYEVQNGNISNFILPRLDDFRRVGGPYQSSRTQIINGQMSSSTSLSYDFVALNKGTYIIGAASAKVNGETVSSNTLEIKVVDAGSASPQASQPNTRQQGSQSSKQSGAQSSGFSDDDIFIIASVSKSNPYKGEQIVLSYKLYTRVNIARGEYEDKAQFKDFWVNEIEGSEDQNFATEVYNGKYYNTKTIQRIILVPQKAGKLNIEPLVLKVLVQVQEKTGNFMEDFFGGRVRNIEKKIKSQTLSINVKELPDPAGLAFTGIVGDYTLETSLVHDAELNTNSAITYKIKISGTGNLGLTTHQRITFPNAFETFEPKITDNIKPKNFQMTGTRNIEYLLIPRSPGKFTLPPYQFNFFNPKTGKYVQLEGKEYTLDIKGDAQASANKMVGGVQKEEIAAIDTDIRYIYEGKIKLSTQAQKYYLSILFFLLTLGFPISGIVLFLMKDKIRNKDKDVALEKMKTSGKNALKSLKAIQKRKSQLSDEALYDEIAKVIYKYFAEREQLNFADLTREKLQEVLNAKEIETSLTDRALSLLDECEFARFSPKSTVQYSSEILQKTENLIKDLEK